MALSNSRSLTHSECLTYNDYRWLWLLSKVDKSRRGTVIHATTLPTGATIHGGFPKFFHKSPHFSLDFPTNPKSREKWGDLWGKLGKTSMKGCPCALPLYPAVNVGDNKCRWYLAFNKGFTCRNKTCGLCALGILKLAEHARFHIRGGDCRSTRWLV